jgi:hypothetical protein
MKSSPPKSNEMIRQNTTERNFVETPQEVIMDAPIQWPHPKCLVSLRGEFETSEGLQPCLGSFIKDTHTGYDF